MFTLLSPDQRVELAEGIKADMLRFLAAMLNEQGLDIKSLGLKNLSLNEVLTNLVRIYQLGRE